MSANQRFLAGLRMLRPDVEATTQIAPAPLSCAYPGTIPGTLRHQDHRFEWTRAQFRAWAEGVAARHGYAVTLQGIGPADPELGAPTQMAVFGRAPAVAPAEGAP